MLVQERVIVLTANQPQNYFLRAQQQLAENNAKAAAGELRMGAAYLEMQASRGPGQDQSQLTQSAEKLRQLAGKIEGKQQIDQQQQDKLKKTLAKANHELAQHLHSLAQREIENKKAIMAGHDLKAAVDSLAAAYVWSGQQPAQEATTAIQQAQTLAMQLMTPGQSQQSQQQQSQQQQAQSDDPADRAQTAGAQLDQTGGPIPQNASQTIDQLGQAIEQAGSTFQSGGQSQQ